MHNKLLLVFAENIHSFKMIDREAAGRTDTGMKGLIAYSGEIR